MRTACFTMTMVWVLTTLATASAEVTSGPQVGDRVGAFTVTKVAGNPDDGFPAGRSGCYRCKTGSKPVVMVFARSADEQFAKLLKEIDEEVEEHADDKMMCFVNMIGADADSLPAVAQADADTGAGADAAAARTRARPSQSESTSGSLTTMNS